MKEGGRGGGSREEVREKEGIHSAPCPEVSGHSWHIPPILILSEHPDWIIFLKYCYQYIANRLISGTHSYCYHGLYCHQIQSITYQEPCNQWRDHHTSVLLSGFTIRSLRIRAMLSTPHMPTAPKSFYFQAVIKDLINICSLDLVLMQQYPTEIQQDWKEWPSSPMCLTCFPWANH